jgi:hypothetical protein
LFPLVYVKEMGTGAAVISDKAVSVDEIEPLGRGAVAVVNRVVHSLDQNRQAYVEAEATGLRRLFTFRVVLVLAVDYVFFDVYRHLPSIGRMGFPDVHHKELNLAAEPVVDLFYAPNLGAEGRSSVAAENERDRAFAAIIGQTDPFLCPQEFEIKVRRFLPHGGSHFVSRDDRV